MLSPILSPYRLSKPIFIFVCLLLVLGLAFLQLASHEESRGYMIDVVKKVGVSVGVSASDVSGNAQEDAMREWEFRRALQHEGTSARVQAFLDKARSGKAFTVASIGGSVSKGRGLTPPKLSHERPAHDTFRRSPEGDSVTTNDVPDDSPQDNIDLTEALPSSAESEPEPTEAAVEENQRNAVSHPIAPLVHLGASTLYSHENLHMQIFEWLNETFPNPDNRFINGAQGGVGAAYFGWCFKEHIPEDSDLVLLELGINDLLEFDVISQYEHLVRGLLELKNKPAVINIETFTTLFPSLISSSSFHNDVLSFYDVPSLSIRDVILPRILADPQHQMRRWFRTGDDVAMGDPKVREWGGVPVDVMHISAMGHSLAAGLVIRYLHEQIDRSTPYGLGALGRLTSTPKKPTVRIMDVPATTLTGLFNPAKADMRHAPVCRSQNSGKPHGKVSSLVDDFSEGTYRGLTLADGSHGWSQWSWKEKRYLIAREPGSRAVFDFTISLPQEPVISDDPSAFLLDGVDDETGETPSRVHEAEGEDDLSVEQGFQRGSLTHRSAGLPKIRRSSTFRRPHGTSQTLPGRRYISQPDARQNPQAGGSILIGYQRSAKLGLGSVWCWIDDDREGGQRVDGWWKLDKRNMGMVKEIAAGLAPGKHTLTCEVLEDTLDPTGGTEFRLFAVMHD
ncbi:hypothetical protein I308_101834 [Cryptococcus tetragattii IND107]|uniref:SGNH hydrolase-type esterase domain-containing protein n=1 Tax=Cryptococcus tetragattii IND107 TaxID=1296105 RepID=A0ABR3BVX6_9TREE|nr:hypothetical protein I308_02696 [Cryptococcus tetragattii IND107]